MTILKNTESTVAPARVTIKPLNHDFYDVNIACGVSETTITKLSHNEDGESVREEVAGYVTEALYLCAVEAKTYEELIAKAIHVRYSQDDELALINKKIAGTNEDEYVEYRGVVADIKERAREIFA